MGQSSQKCAAEVAVPGIAQTLYYQCQAPGLNGVEVGSQVSVQLGRRTGHGWVTGFSSLEEATKAYQALVKKRADSAEEESKQLSLLPDDASQAKLKSINEGEKVFSEEQLKLFDWMSTYYGASIAEVIDNALPKIVKLKRAKKEEAFDIHQEEDKDLTEDQQKSVNQLVEAIDSNTFSPHLLFGVTGSGKTEVYIRAIKHCLAQGKSALIIVPEIALTPQLVERFESRLNTPLAILHSQITPSQRWKAWSDLLENKKQVAVGARSAIFAPAENLGLVIVDEEHDQSYKQSDGLRYHGRDVAVMRAKLANATIVLGSATPSFESLLNAKRGRYEVLEMPERVSSRPLPTMEVVDLNSFKRKDMPSENISPTLFQKIEETLAAKNQVIILYNRRGFSTFLQCESCNEVVTCPSCAVTMTYHKRKNILLCHYCDLKVSPPSRCPVCIDPHTSRIEEDGEDIGILSHRGAGTERVVEELSQLFPNARIDRMDRDTVGKKGAYKEILTKMRKRESDILVGTQMLAKGHDLPGVTLVGIIDADVGLHVPDFRSSEKIFQLITQAAGRAGRGEDPGRVIVQSRQPRHPTIVATTTGRFMAFARYELDLRKDLGYPPWQQLLRLIVSTTDVDTARESAKKIREIVDQIVAENKDEETFCQVLGPTLAPIEKLRGRHRWHIIIKTSSRTLPSQIAGTLNNFKRNVKVEDFRLSVDVDPIDML